jgi:hypothetical protein
MEKSPNSDLKDTLTKFEADSSNFVDSNIDTKLLTQGFDNSKFSYKRKDVKSYNTSDSLQTDSELDHRPQD